VAEVQQEHKRELAEVQQEHKRRLAEVQQGYEKRSIERRVKDIKIVKETLEKKLSPQAGP
jgi:hypothetical protein